jgi:hypothetical protein
MNYTYAGVRHNTVVQIISVVHPIESGEHNIDWFEISTTNPQPQVGWRYNRENGSFAPATEEVIIYETAKLVAAQAIDEAAGLARKKFVTDIPGQEELYREKYEQAVDFLTGGQVRYSDYPLLEVESIILDIPLKNIADTIVKRRSTWITKMSAIESLRLFGKHNLVNCTSLAEVNKLKALIVHKLNELA